MAGPVATCWLVAGPSCADSGILASCVLTSKVIVRNAIHVYQVFYLFLRAIYISESKCLSHRELAGTDSGEPRTPARGVNLRLGGELACSRSHRECHYYHIRPIFLNT